VTGAWNENSLEENGKLKGRLGEILSSPDLMFAFSCKDNIDDESGISGTGFASAN
jgi:hypothetical protein